MTEKDLDMLGGSGNGQENIPAETEVPESRQPVFPQPPFTVPAQVPREIHESVPLTYSSPYREYESQVKPEERRDPDGNPVGETAGFWPRLTAAVIDVLISAVLWLLYCLIASIFTDRLDEPFFFSAQLITVLLYLAVKTYYIISQWGFGRTLGKRALRIKLISTDTYGKPDLWTVFFRETFGKFLSFISVVGSFMIFGKKHLPLHDRLADTEVVYDIGVKAPAPQKDAAIAEPAVTAEPATPAQEVPEVVIATVQEIPEEETADTEEHSDEEVE